MSPVEHFWSSGIMPHLCLSNLLRRWGKIPLDQKCSTGNILSHTGFFLFRQCSTEIHGLRPTILAIHIRGPPAQLQPIPELCQIEIRSTKDRLFEAYDNAIP
jgi:hypothetical protein